MRFLQERAFLIALVVTGVVLPLQAYASGTASAPEPVSLTLLAVGVAGLGAAEFIRRRRGK